MMELVCKTHQFLTSSYCIISDMYSYCILTTLLVVFTMVNLEVDASYNTPHHSWKGYSYSMLCNHHGSKVAKAHKVRKELVDDYKGFL